MEAGEPDCLSEIGTLAAGLEVEPLLGVPAIGGRGGTEFVVFVVGIYEIFNYGTRFP